MGGTSSLKYIITPEGRIKNTGTNAAPVWEWEYNLTDHLGNVRTVIRPMANNYAEIREYTNYFPFGMKMTPGLESKLNGQQVPVQRQGAANRFWAELVRLRGKVL